MAPRKFVPRTAGATQDAPATSSDPESEPLNMTPPKDNDSTRSAGAPSADLQPSAPAVMDIDATKDPRVSDDGAADLRGYLEISQKEVADLTVKLKAAQAALGDRQTLDSTKAGEIVSAKTEIGTLTAENHDLATRLVASEGLLETANKEIDRLNSVLTSTHVNALSNLPEGTYALCESATITILSGGAQHQAANRDDIVFVGTEDQRPAVAVKYPNRRVFCVDKAQVEELQRLGFLYP